MPVRPTLPADDLYARLGVPVDASPEAIELAWRGLLRRHHPDIAGPDGLERAKRINVAHDWLSDPELRARYDRERGTGIRSGRRPRDPVDGASRTRAVPRRAPTTAERVEAVVARTAHPLPDELDRLALAEPAPIAFLATLRRFVPPELQAALETAERAAMSGLPRTARSRPGVRDAVSGQLADIILGDVLDDLLGEPGADRARERLTRGWDAAVGQPRYGPATPAVQALLERLGGLSPDEVRWLAGTGGRDLGPAPWPAATSRDEDEALRVSTELAATDAREATRGAPAAARRAAARVAHLLVLRHAFAPATFERAAAPWLGTLIDPTQATTRVRSRR